MKSWWVSACELKCIFEYTLNCKSFVLVITCLGGELRINCSSAFLKISEFSKVTRVIYPKNCPNQICGYWLITQNQQKLCIETNIFSQLTVTNQQVGNYKITFLTVQCWLQWAVWLIIETWPTQSLSYEACYVMRTSPHMTNLS